MNLITKRFASILALCITIGCHRVPSSYNYQNQQDFNIVLNFLDAFNNKDLERMMACISEDAREFDYDISMSKKSMRQYYSECFSKKDINISIRCGKPYRQDKYIRIHVKQDMRYTTCYDWKFEVKQGKIVYINKDPS